ncbi:MAG: DedA family protein [Bifidobacteriaceae bacterium]|jgi:membrane protein DedA with SNARE-associated domain|nr:DedA family protein [Bifidobacteriaceae bacterium]
MDPDWILLAFDPLGLGTLWDAINDFIRGLAQSPWALAAVYLVAVIDGFFPPVPAETLIVATSAVYSSAGLWWEALLVWVLGAAGALTGDTIAYSLGRWFNAGHWRIFRAGKGQTALAWARRLFARGAAPLLMVARFIPGGRVAVNLTAGTVRYPLRRFLLVDAAAAVCWSAYSVGVGHIAGKAARENPLLGVVCGIAFAMTLGILVQWLINRHYDRTPAAGSDGAGAPAPDDTGALGETVVLEDPAASTEDGQAASGG